MTSPSSTNHVTVTAAILATVMTFSASGYAYAQEKAPPAPRQGPTESMGPMQKQMMHGMMHQMETCMERMGKMDESAQAQMQAQMMARMQSCMSQVQPGVAEPESGPEHESGAEQESGVEHESGARPEPEGEAGAGHRSQD